MDGSFNIKIQMPVTVTRQVPDRLAGDCLPGYLYHYVTGSLGHLLVQSIVVSNTEMYYVTGEIKTSASCQVTLSSSVFAILILLEGTLEIQENTTAHSFIKPGTITFLFSRDQKISITHARNQRPKGILFLYPVETIVSVLSFYPLLNDIRTSVEKKKVFVLVESLLTPAVLEKVYQLTHIPFIPSMEEFYKKTITEIAHQIFSDLSSKPSDTSLKLYDIASIHRAKDYIDEHLSTHITIKQIAKKVGINQLKLKKGFKEIYGTGVYGYLLQQRLTAAKKALELTRLTVKEISIQAGYKSLSNFCTAFKKRFDATPGEVRKQKGKS